jgi:uncharacterized membrane protein YuzA (DUF378 family)
MPSPELNYANHRKIIPQFHIGLFSLVLLNLVWSFVALAAALFGFGQRWVPVVSAIVGLAAGLALLGLFFASRIFALGVQDRVICLEQRLRLAPMLPADLKDRMGELTKEHLIALRFADDSEIAELVRAALDEKIADREVLKKRIRVWKADTMRI